MHHAYQLTLQEPLKERIKKLSSPINAIMTSTYLKFLLNRKLEAALPQSSTTDEALQLLNDAVLSIPEITTVYTIRNFYLKDKQIIEHIRPGNIILRDLCRRVIAYNREIISAFEKITPPEFSWSMPSAEHYYRPMQEFLRSDEQEITLTGIFKDIKEARKFIKQGNTDGYLEGSGLYDIITFDHSYTGTAFGDSKINSGVHIVKTRKWFEREATTREYNRKLEANVAVKKENEKILQLLGEDEDVDDDSSGSRLKGYSE